MKRRNRRHRVSLEPAVSGTVVVEDLGTRGMIRSVKGAVEHSGANVKAKSGLNRDILAAGWCRVYQPDVCGTAEAVGASVADDTHMPGP